MLARGKSDAIEIWMRIGFVDWNSRFVDWNSIGG